MTRARARRPIARLLLLLGLLAVARPGEAQGPEALPAPQPANLPPDEDFHRLALLPLLDLTGQHPAEAGRAQALLQDSLARYPRLEVLGGPPLAERVRGTETQPQRTLRDARDFARLGRTSYARVRLKEAIELLSRAVRDFEAIHHELTDPQEVGQTLLALARAHLENGSVTEAELMLFRLLLVDPSVRLPPGEYSESLIAMFDRARFRAGHERTSALGNRLDRALAIGRQIRADYVVLATLRPADAVEGGRPAVAPVLGVLIYDVARRIPLAAEEETPTEPPALLVDGLDLLGSRLAACIPNDVWLTRQRSPERHDRWLTFDTSFMHSLFVQQPLHDPSQNFGLGTGLTWSPRNHLVLLGRLSFTTSRNDHPWEDLLDPVNIVRAVLGAGIGQSSPRYAIYSITGLDFSWPLRFRWTRNPDCKWQSQPPQECEQDVHVHDPGPVFGLHVGAGGQWVFAPPLFIGARIGLSYLVLPTRGNELNLPFESELGLGYRF